MKSEPGGDHSPTKFSIAEIQGDRSACKFSKQIVANILQYHSLHVAVCVFFIALKCWTNIFLFNYQPFSTGTAVCIHLAVKN